MKAKIEKIKWVGDDTEQLVDAHMEYDCAVVTEEGSLHVSMDIDERNVGLFALPGCSDRLHNLINQFFSKDSEWGEKTAANVNARILADWLKKQ
jgi:hypothetical protein